MCRILIMILVLAALLFPLTAAADANVPEAAESLGKQLDNQLMERFTGSGASWVRGSTDADVRRKIMIMGTTPANISNLGQANALSRQMTEEVSRWLINRGYRYDEIRKGRDIRFVERAGEFILTRKVPQLASNVGVGQAILAGTYVISGNAVRFTMSILCVNSGEVLAKATATIPITPDLKPMLVENHAPGAGLLPSVYTRLKK